jgi:acyl-homoserine lactone acylase PvdQ
MRVRFEGVRFWGFETVVVGRGNALGWGDLGG